VRSLIWYISAVVSLALGAYLLWSDYHIKNDGIITEGIVQQQVPGRSGRWFFSYRVGLNLHIGVTRARHTLKEPIKISYLSNDPDVSRDLTDDFWFWTGTLLFLASIALTVRAVVVGRRSTQHDFSQQVALIEPS